MKKFLSLLLVFLMVFSVTTGVFADESITLNCNLTCDGENEVTKKTGDIVTVTYILENITDEEAGYVMSSHTNEIYYDPDFFEYVEGSEKVAEGLSLGAGHQKWSDPKKRSVAFAGAEFDLKTYAPKQTIGTFDLKVIATKDSSTVYSAGLFISSDKGDYRLETTDLVVKIGDAVVVPKYQLTFETNGGSDIATAKFDKGTTVDLKDYKPVRKNYDFDGWYSDEDLTEKITSIVMDKNKTVYAKWTKESTGGGGGGGGGGGAVINYKIVFDTDDGSALKDLIQSANSTVDLSKYVPEKDGFDFGGWYTDPELKNKVTSIKVTENITLYAKWTAKGEGDAPAAGYTPDILNSGDHFAYIVGYEDGTVHPEANITRAEVSTIIFRLLTEDVRNQNMTKENDFADVPADQWYNTAISTMASMGVLKGYEGYFRPDDAITRAEFAAIVARLAEKSGTSSVSFNDIGGHWAQAEILKAASLGWIQGFEGSFRPDDAILRAEAMTIINRVLCRLPENTADLLPEMKVWSDNTDTAMWYYLNVQEATNSHGFEEKADGVHEKWTELKENPDWTGIEK